MTLKATGIGLYVPCKCKCGECPEPYIWQFGVLGFGVRYQKDYGTKIYEVWTPWSWKKWTT